MEKKKREIILNKKCFSDIKIKFVADCKFFIINNQSVKFSNFPQKKPFAICCCILTNMHFLSFQLHKNIDKIETIIKSPILDLIFFFFQSMVKLCYNIKTWRVKLAIHTTMNK